MSIIGGLIGNVIQGWMEDPNARDATWRTHMNAMRQNADVLKSQWDKSNKYDGYWRGEEMTRKTQYEEMLGNRGKGYSVGNHMTDTNSVESVLEGLEKNAAR